MAKDPDLGKQVELARQDMAQASEAFQKLHNKCSELQGLGPEYPAAKEDMRIAARRFGVAQERYNDLERKHREG